MNKNYIFNLRKLCTPASIYFFLSLFAFIIILFQNIGGQRNILCVGDYKCDIGNIFLALFLNLIYILFWTFILDLMCKNGYEKLSWLIILMPILLAFIILSMTILYYPVV